jgi:hypothetical protein
LAATRSFPRLRLESALSTSIPPPVRAKLPAMVAFRMLATVLDTYNPPPTPSTWLPDRVLLAIWRLDEGREDGELTEIR